MEEFVAAQHVVLIAFCAFVGSGCVGAAQSVIETSVTSALLKESALALCETRDHESGPNCEDVVDDRHGRCSERLFEQASTTEEYVVCLGFIIEEPEPEMAAH